MRAKTIIVVFTVVLTTATVGFAWKEHLATRNARIALAAAAHRRAGMEAGVWRMEAWIAALEKDRANLPTTSGQGKTSAISEPPKTTAADQRPSATDLILKDPKLQILYLAAARAAQAATYTPLFRELGLSPAQREQFMGIVMKREELNTDLLAVTRAQGRPADDPAVATLKQQAADEAKAALTDLLGADGYPQVPQFERTVVVRYMVGQFAGVAALDGNPLSPEQAGQMTQALAAASSTYRSGGSVSNSSIDWDAADQGVVGILTPAQLNLYWTIEPIGGGISRWSGRLLTLIDRAQKAEAAEARPAAPQPPRG
jgi:hypothetical protein